MAFTEKIIKDPKTCEAYEIQQDTSSGVEENQSLFEGLECRWEPVQSRKGETLSLMVLAKGDNTHDSSEIYSQFIEQLRNIYGEQRDYSPISPDQMKVTLNPKLLASETKVRTFNKSFLTRLTYPFILRLSCLLGRIIFKFGLKVGDLDGKDYLNTLTKNSDFQKFDDTVRMTIDSNPEQRIRLVDYLEAKMHAGKLCYGIHISDSALITCMVFDRKESHLHFVDGASGGYALASKQMKSQMNVNAGKPQDNG